MTKTVKDLIENLNAFDFQVFPQKNNPGKNTISIKTGDNKRYFVTRVSMGLNDNGEAVYGWARGKEFEPRQDDNSAPSA